MYNEEESIGPFFKKLSKALSSLPYAFEVIFIDDGSADDSIKQAKKLRSKNHIVRVIALARNFGKEIATTAGINHAEGQAAVIIDSDLQHPVEKIKEFIAKWESGADVVIGVRDEQGHKSGIKTLGSKTFYKIMSFISDTEIIPHSTDFRLIDRQVIDEFNRFTERERITRGLIDWLGFQRDVVYFKPNEREFGKPTYNFFKLMKLATNSFRAHSLMPLKLAGYIGTIFILFFGAMGLALYVEMYLMDDPMGLAISGTALLAILLLFAIGIILSSLGLIALYIANIHGEVTNRPLYVVRKERR